MRSCPGDATQTTVGNALGRLIRTQLADGATSTNYFDRAGQLIVSTDARANNTFYGYDAAGRSVAVTNALGQVTRSFYDGAGNLTNTVDALGRSTTFLYDALNRRVQTIYPGSAGASPAGSGAPPEPLTTLTTYDALGRRVAETDQAGIATRFGYDALGRLTGVTNALGYVTRYAYDELGQQITQTDANNHTTSFEYDALGRRTKRVLPAGQFETYAYNTVGNLTSRTDFNNRTTTFTYDVMTRLLQKVPDPSFAAPPVIFTYNALGQRTSMSDASGGTSYAYDNRDRLIQKTIQWPLNAQPIALNYSYDTAGNVTNIISSNANGTAVNYQYDTLNRLKEVSDPHVGRTIYQYDPVGSLQSYTYPNGVNSFYQYDALNRLTNMASSKVLMSLANYAYDPAGNRLARNSTVQSLPIQSFSFDANDRLNSDTYDANGNTLVGSAPAPGAVVGAPPTTLSSTYDFENRLTHATTALNSQPSTIDLTYDGDGNRVRKTVGGVTSFYLVDDLNPTGYAQVLEELTLNPANPLLATPAVTRVYTYGHALLWQDRLDGAGWSASFYGYDGHSNVRYLTDALGQITDTYDYDAFGNLIASTGATPNNYLFSGEQFDPDLGLYYLRARYHNPNTGRFWTSDSLEGFNDDPASLHKYTYCANNPINCVDRSGNFSISEVVTAGTISAATQAIIGSLMRGVVAASYGLNFKESAGAAFDSADVSEDVGSGFITGLAGFGVGKLAAAAVKPVFNAVRQGASFLLRWSQRWAVRRLTQLEARWQVAWTSLKNRLLRNPAAAKTEANVTRLGITRNNPADWRATRDLWDQTGYGGILSDANRAAIARGRTPIVDNAWISHFPEDAGLIGERIPMHHIQGTPITVPLSATRHLDAHMPGGFRYNPGGPGSALPVYPPPNP